MYPACIGLILELKGVKLVGITPLQLLFCMLMHVAPIKPDLRLLSLSKVSLR